MPKSDSEPVGSCGQMELFCQHSSITVKVRLVREILPMLSAIQFTGTFLEQFRPGKPFRHTSKFQTTELNHPVSG